MSSIVARARCSSATSLIPLVHEVRLGRTPNCGIGKQGISNLDYQGDGCSSVAQKMNPNTGPEFKLTVASLCLTRISSLEL